MKRVSITLGFFPGSLIFVLSSMTVSVEFILKYYLDFSSYVNCELKIVLLQFSIVNTS